MSNWAIRTRRTTSRLLLLTSVLAALPAFAAAPPTLASKARLMQNFGNLPLSFEANRGQADPSVQFLSRGAGYGLYFSGQGAVLALRKHTEKSSRLLPAPRRPSFFGIGLPAPGTPTALDQEGTESADANPAVNTDILRMQLVGADPHATIQGLEDLPGTANYILGNDPAQWHTAIPTFARVQYSAVYKGIDLVYYGDQQRLEYDFVIAPHADPKPIRLHFDGASSLSLDADGNLAIHAPDGTVAFRKPTVYQPIRGVRRPIRGAFQLLADNTVSFALGSYDRNQPLVIDPILSYSTFLGGSVDEYAVSVNSDSAGNIYICGLTFSGDFPLTAGAFQAINYAQAQNSVSTAFISKLNPSGTALLYSTYLGGIGIPNTPHLQGDYAKSIAIDSAGNAYVTGYTFSSNFPITSGAFQTSDRSVSASLATGFVSKLNPAGTGLVYSTYLGGESLDEPTAIKVDSTGNAYISGLTFSSSFPTTPGAFQSVNNSAGSNGFNAFVTKLNPTGSALVYSTYLGGASSDGSTLSSIYETNPIVVDKSGNAYVAGFTASGNFPVTANAFQKVSHASGYAVTVTKLNPTGSGLIFSTYLGGSTTSICEGLAVDSGGNVYVAGYTSDHDFPVTVGAFQTSNKGNTSIVTSADAPNNGFITKLNPTGSALVFSTYLGGTTGPWGGDHIYGLAIDAANNVYVAGGAMSADFPVTANAFQLKNRGATHCCDYLTYTSNGFLTELNPSGSALLYSTFIGGSGTQNPNGPGGWGDEAINLALGRNSSVYLVGYTSSPNFPVSAGAFQTKYHAIQSTGFAAAFDLGAAPVAKETSTTLSASGNPVVPGTAVTFTAVVALTTGTGTPSGSVTFSIDEATVATVSLNTAGKATYTTASLPAGAHYVLATYTGNATYASSGDGFNEFINPAKPLITPVAGIYNDQQTVTITAPTAGSVLYYTLDGTVPSVFSPTYTAPLIVNKTTTVSAVAVSQHDATSAEATNAYTIIGSPSVLIGPATAVATPKATLNAFVNDLGEAGTYYFQYGTSPTGLTTITTKTALAASTTRSQIAVTLTTLAAKTTYYYQLVISTPGGTSTSAITAFTTN